MIITSIYIHSITRMVLDIPMQDQAWDPKKGT